MVGGMGPGGVLLGLRQGKKSNLCALSKSPTKEISKRHINIKLCSRLPYRGGKFWAPGIMPGNMIKAAPRARGEISFLPFVVFRLK